MNPPITITEVEDLYGKDINKYCGILVNDADHGWIITLGIFQDLKIKLPFLTEAHNIRAFLYQTATQRCINFLRRKKIMNGNETETLEWPENRD